MVGGTQKNNFFILSSLSFLLFLIIGFLVTKSNLLFIDRLADNFVSLTSSPSLIELFASITDSFYGPVVLVLLIFILVIIKRSKIAAGLALGVLGTNYLTSLFKDFFDRNRPDGSLVGAGGMSYPSGHVSSIVIITFFTIFAIHTLIKRKYLRILSEVIVIAYAVAIMASRLYLKVHWLTDIIGGVLLALAIGYFVLGLVQKDKSK